MLPNSFGQYIGIYNAPFLFVMQGEHEKCYAYTKQINHKSSVIKIANRDP
jgi:hypothetical protein